jgi:leader peptidase (prepilin peptidase)/N-methyltransferase
MPDMPLVVWIAFAGVLGLLVGSFLNVVILRLPERMAAGWRQEARDVLELEADSTPLPPGIVREPSHCPHCKHPLSARDNIPLLGWLLLGGRCRYCKTRISIQYPLVELLSGVLSAVIVWKFGPSWAALAGLVFTWTLIALSGIDVRTQLLPDQLTFPLLWLGLLLALLQMFVSAPSAIIGAAIGYLSLWSVYWLFKLITGKEGMGYGDFKLFAALGAWLGWKLLPLIILLAAVAGAVLGIFMIVLRGRDRAAPMPFGPYLAAAGWLAMMYGDSLVSGYLRISGLKH